MVDYFALFLPHLLLALAAVRLLRRSDLDNDPGPTEAADEASLTPAGKRRR